MSNVFNLGRYRAATAMAGASLSLLWAADSGAQLPPLAEVSSQYLPTSRVPDSGGLGAQISSYDAQVNVPLVLGEGTFFVPGLRYHIDSVSYAADERHAEPRSCTDHLAYSVVTAGVVARVRLVGSLWLGTFLGRTLHRRYELKNADGLTVPGGEANLPNEIAFRVGLTFRIPPPDTARSAESAR